MYFKEYLHEKSSDLRSTCCFLNDCSLKEGHLYLEKEVKSPLTTHFQLCSCIVI